MQQATLLAETCTAASTTLCALGGTLAIPIGSIVVPFYGLYLEPDKEIPKRNYQGAYGYRKSGLGVLGMLGLGAWNLGLAC